MDFFIRNLSTLGPVGTNLPAPGTFGSLAGLVVFCFLFWFSPLSPIGIMILFSILFIAGIPLCTRAEVLLGKEDPPEATTKASGRCLDKVKSPTRKLTCCRQALDTQAQSVATLEIRFVVFGKIAPFTQTIQRQIKNYTENRWNSHDLP